MNHVKCYCRFRESLPHTRKIALNSTTLFSLVFNQLTLSASGFSHVSKRTAVLVDVTLSRQTTWYIITPINYYAYFAGCVV